MRNDYINGKVKIVQHADDCIKFKGSNSLKKALEKIQEFSNVAGPKFNMDETECLLTGTPGVLLYLNEEYIYGVKIAENT